MHILVSGSFVTDNIMVLRQNFIDLIDPKLLHILNVSSDIESINNKIGGTGGNIIYNLVYLLNANGVVISALGIDGEAYLNHLERLGISTKYIYRDPLLHGAFCNIFTDKLNNQINGYYPGPMERAGDMNIADIEEDVGLAIVSPSTVKVMIKHLKELASLGIETIFDPGQQITSFSIYYLRLAIQCSSFTFGNYSEIIYLQSQSNWSKEEILKMGKIIVTTFGKEGSSIEKASMETIKVPACKDIKVVDPTGAGDAFRAGFIVAYKKGYDLKVCLQFGSTVASFAVETHGGQEHHFTPKEFMARYEKNYGILQESDATSLSV